MDFFSQQEASRKKTKWLVLYFILAVLGVAASMYVLFLWTQYFLEPENPDASPVPFYWWDGELASSVLTGVIIVVALASFYKLKQLSSGGGTVAKLMGGRLVDIASSEKGDQKLINVVEEMSIASGVPVPELYVMDNEVGINAFAAGTTPNNAALGVSRGCLEHLSRDELQGVIAHEFSHILNGDMKLNIRIMGVIFGILCLSILGRIAMHMGARMRGKNSPGPAIAIFGFGVFIIGSIGVFFGKLIQAAVSRQREFLADASAVQFTRNPDGISGALKKIDQKFGSKIANPHAGEIAHMAFSCLSRNSWFSLFATHPPLSKRIEEITGRPYTAENNEEHSSLSSSENISSLAPSSPLTPSPSSQRSGVAGAFGNVTPAHLAFAAAFHEELQSTLSEGTLHSPKGAATMILAILLDEDKKTRANQLQAIKTLWSDEAEASTLNLFPIAKSLAIEKRLPLIELCLPALRQISHENFLAFDKTLEAVIVADEKITLWEYCLQRIVRRNLKSHFEKPRSPRYKTLKKILEPVEILFTGLAKMNSPENEERAFAAGQKMLRKKPYPTNLTLKKREKVSLEEIDGALEELALAIAPLKRNFLDGCIAIIAHDCVIHHEEGELIRTIADSLDCPLPPLTIDGAVFFSSES